MAEPATVAGAGVEVREGRLGRGVFATRRFAEGETVEICPTLELADSESVGRLGDYVFGSEDEQVVVLILGFGSLYNHSGEPNLEYVQDDPGAIAFLAVRDVEAGDELTIDYGADWWEARGLVPD